MTALAEVLVDELLSSDPGQIRTSGGEYADSCIPDMVCGECGFRWCGYWTRGSRLDPPEPRRPDCPACSS